jgi:mono/diheme cytochrome c family protein
MSQKMVPGPVLLKRIALFVFYGFAGITLQPAWAEPGNPVKGKTIYERLCVTCHGAQGKGDGPAGPMMTPRPADFTSAKIKSKPDSELLKSIQDGRPPTTMPGFQEQLSAQQLSDVLAYIRSLGK